MMDELTFRVIVTCVMATGILVSLFLAVLK